LKAIEEEFWASKKGQKLLKKHCLKTFASFIENVPAGLLLKNKGLKRHYKGPGPVVSMEYLQAQAA
jgi:hypothetical protein